MIMRLYLNLQFWLTFVIHEYHYYDEVKVDMLNAGVLHAHYDI